MRFHEVRFPTTLSFGSVGGPERRTEIVRLANGFEERNSPWSDSMRRYDAGVGMRSLDDIGTLIAFFEARRGQLYAFRWKDWSDFKSSRASEPVTVSDQLLGIGDGVRTHFPLSKRYASGAQSYDRPIKKPVADTVVVGLDGDIVGQASYGIDFDDRNSELRSSRRPKAQWLPQGLSSMCRSASTPTAYSPRSKPFAPVRCRPCLSSRCVYEFAGSSRASGDWRHDGLSLLGSAPPRWTSVRASPTMTPT